MHEAETTRRGVLRATAVAAMAGFGVVSAGTVSADVGDDCWVEDEWCDESIFCSDPQQPGEYVAFREVCCEDDNGDVECELENLGCCNPRPGN